MPNSKLPYDSFAHVYDQEPHEQVAQAFFAAARPYLLEQNNGGRILELGCGTGILTRLLARAGMPVIGVDASRPMLAVARARCARLRKPVEWVEADFARMPRFADCTAAVACADVLNHLPPGMLGRVLRRVRETLRPPGLFIFDTLNRFCFERYWDEQVYYMESKAGDLVLYCTWHAERRIGKARMIAFGKSGAQGYQKRETVLQEYLHEESTMRRLLQAAGFSRVISRPWSPWEDQHREPMLDRTLWFAYASAPRRRPSA